MHKGLCTALLLLLTPSLGHAQIPTPSASARSSDPAAEVACMIGDNFYWACHLISETPEGQGIGAAAMRMAACMWGSNRVGAKGSDVTIPFRFEKLTAQQVIMLADCPYDPTYQSGLTGANPNYRHTPTGREFDKYYPSQAHSLGKEGLVILECMAIKSEYKYCKVLREAPINLGFGASALQLSTLMQLRR
jgi:hypothetical protein